MVGGRGVVREATDSTNRCYPTPPPSHRGMYDPLCPPAPVPALGVNELHDSHATLAWHLLVSLLRKVFCLGRMHINQSHFSKHWDDCASVGSRQVAVIGHLPSVPRTSAHLPLFLFRVLQQIALEVFNYLSCARHMMRVCILLPTVHGSSSVCRRCVVNVSMRVVP